MKPERRKIWEMVGSIGGTVEIMGDVLEDWTRGESRGLEAFCHFLEIFRVESAALDANLRVITLKKSMNKSHLIKINEEVARIYDDANSQRMFFEELCRQDNS